MSTEARAALIRYLVNWCDYTHAEALGDPARGSGVSRTLDALEAKGLIKRTRYRARSVVALDPTADLSNFTTAELAAEVARRLAQ